MILASKRNDSELVALIPSIQHHINEWQIVNVVVSSSGGFFAKDVLDSFMAAYQECEGVVLSVKERRITALMRLGVVKNYGELKAEIESKLPDHSCRVLAKKMTAVGLKQIQIDLMPKDDKQVSMFSERESREENVIMIADDDDFVRKTMKHVLRRFGETVEVAAGDQVVEEYLRCNPDVVLLDIHMPGKNGLDVVEGIMDVDIDAYVVVFSADSVADKVLKAAERGAVGFVSKPPDQEKLAEYINYCITIK